MRQGGRAACMGQKTNSYRNFAGKLEEKRQLGRPRCRRKDNTTTNLKKEQVRTSWTGFTLLRTGKSGRLKQTQ
jgi:hypothetical protein